MTSTGRGSLDVELLNQRRPVIKPRLTSVEGRALAEAESLYSPQGVLRLLTTYFRSGIGGGSHVGHGQFCDFDHMVSRILGVPGVATSYGSQVYGGGKGLDMFEMYVSTMGEGIERLLGSFAVFDWDDQVVHGTYAELTARGMNCLHPDELPVFSDRQFSDPNFGFDRWGEDDEVGWVPGKRLMSGETCFVPAQLVLFIYYRSSDEPRIGLAPSGGMASHISRERAIVHAVAELIERDAINLRWHNEIPLDRIVVDVPLRVPAVNRAWRDLQQIVNPPTLYLHNLDFEEFPVLTAVSFDDWLEELSYNAGGGVGFDLDSSIQSALGEYAQSERSIRICQMGGNWQFSSSFQSLFGISADASPSKFARYIQAITYYGYRCNRDQTRSYFENGPDILLSDLYAKSDEFAPDPMERLVNSLKLRKIDPIMFDFTPPGLTSISLWKAFIPELTDPYPPSSPAVGHPRYREVAARTGREPAGELRHDAVPYP